MPEPSAAPRAMLWSGGQGEDGHRIFTVSSVLGPTEAERCQADHGTSPAYSLKSAQLTRPGKGKVDYGTAKKVCRPILTGYHYETGSSRQ